MQRAPKVNVKRFNRPCKPFCLSLSLLLLLASCGDNSTNDVKSQHDNLGELERPGSVALALNSEVLQIPNNCFYPSSSRATGVDNPDDFRIALLRLSIPALSCKTSENADLFYGKRGIERTAFVLLQALSSPEQAQRLFAAKRMGMTYESTVFVSEGVQSKSQKEGIEYQEFVFGTGFAGEQMRRMEVIVEGHDSFMICDSSFTGFSSRRLPICNLLFTDGLLLFDVTFSRSNVSQFLDDGKRVQSKIKSFLK